RAFRDATGIGRNVAIQVLEFFDKLGLTRRDGDVRRIHRPAAELFE
ncbi:MAG: SelB C-terminal domain-containing protein, partial [Gammaproteobacteria bacterium]